MNFAGKFDAELPVEGSVAHPVAFAHVDGASTHAPSDAIIVPDAQLLFGGDFKRSGVDLVLSKDDHELVLHDYFKGEKRAALASPDGAHLTGDLVNALTGHVEYAQADGAVAAAVVVGHVTKLTGSATAIRNGVSIILNQGDNIDKGDVLQSGADSTLGVTFIDGTVFGLSSNARMVVNEMVYDPNGSNNSSLLSLVAGTISFVAGETAKHGDMKVDTPVATMGIRGTAVLVEIDFAVPGQNDAPSANFQVLVEPDGTTGSYILFDKNTLAPLATVNTPGTLTKISQGVVSFQAGSPLTPDEQKLINDLFTTKFGDNNNTKNTNHAFTDTPVPQSLAPIKLADGTIVTPVIQVVHNSGSGSPSASGGAPGGILHIPGAPTVVTFNDAFTEHANVTGSTALDTQTGQIRFADVNAGDLPTVKVEFSSFIYQDAHHNDITQALSPTEQAAIKAVEAISLQQDPGNNNTGSATWTYSFPDQAFDFLGAGETLTLTYTARVDNNFLQSPEIGTKQFTITITGTNDVPVITSSIPQTIAFVGGTSVPGGDLTAHVPTAGTITFDDPDLTDIHTVSVKLLLDGLKLPPTPLQIFENALTASIATDSTGTGFGKVNWKLADLPVFLADFIPKGETITLTYAVTVTDSQGATSTPQDITVTITGTDTPAVVWIATTSGSSSGGLWSDGSNWETGVAPTANDDAIIITDQLIGLTPSFPVTIDAKTAAVAKSVTMNDFGTSPPKLINLGTLTVSGAFNMSADSVLQNSGGIVIGGGGNFADQSAITNTSTGLIELSGGTLNVQVDIANDGSIKVDSGATLTLDHAAIDGGTINDFSTPPSGSVIAGDIDVTGSSTISNAHLNNGRVTIEANQTLTLDGTTVSGTHFADTADGAIIQIDGDTTLTLSGVTINGGTINDYSPPSSPSGSIIAGDIDITGSSTISNAHLNNGNVTIESGKTLTLTSDTVTGTNFTAGGATILIDGSATLDEVTITGGTITNAGATLTIDAGETLTLQGGASLIGGTLSNSGTLEIEGSSGATLDGITVAGSGSIQVDAAASSATPTLVLDDGTAITDGTLTVGPFGTLAVKTAGGATLNGVHLTNKNSIEVFAGSALTLDQLTMVDNSTGAIAIDGTGMLTLDDAAISGGTVTNNGTLTLDGKTALKSGTLHNYSQINVSSTVNELDSENITNASGIAILALGVLTLDHLTTVDNTGGIITVYGTGKLALNDATINGGTINDYSAAPSPSGSIVAGDIDVTGSSTISGAHLNNGQVTIESGIVLTLDSNTVSGTFFADTADGATIQVDGDTILKLSDVTINGGIINDFSAGASGSIIAGDIDITGSSTISGAHLNNGQVTIESGVVLTLDNDTVTGTHFTDTADGATIQIDGGTTLKLDGVTIDGGTINDFSAPSSPSGSIVAGDIDVIGSSIISDAHLNHGNVTIESNQKLTLDNVTVNGTTITDETSGSIIQIDSPDRLTLEGGATIQGGSGVQGAIGNAGTIEVAGAATLLDATLTNTASGSIVQIDSGDTLTLNDAGITGGTINNFSAGGSGTIDVTDDSTISNAALNGGNVTVEGATLTLDNVTVNGTTITAESSSNTIQIDSSDTLTLEGGATIQGGSHVQGAIGGAGAVEVAGAATLLDVTLTESDVTVESATLTLDNVIVDTATITEETSGSIIQIDSPDRLTLEFGAQILGGPAVQGAISNAGTIVVAGSASLFDVTLTNTASGSIVQIDGHATLTLNDAEITGGTINNFSTGGSGTIDVMGDTTISNATLNSGNVTVEGAPLTLDNVTVNGTSITEEIFSGGVIQIDGATGDTVTLNGVSITGVGLNVAAHGLVQTNGNVTLTNTGVTNDGTIEVTGGTLTITGTGSVADSHGNTGGTIQIDGGAVLDLNVSDTQNVSFSGTGGEFKIDTVGFGGNISGLAAGDEIDLSTIGYGPGTTATYVSNTDNTGGTLNVTNGQHSIALQLVGDYSGAHFAGSVDSAGDTLITLNAIDDTPTITATGGSLAEAANVTNIGATDKASGSITFSDIDLTDRPTVTTSFASFDYKDAAGDDLTLTLTPAQQAAIVALETGLALSPDAANANNGTVGWSYSATDSALDFMAAGDKLVLTYNATVNDGAGDTVTTPVTVTITGSDDAPAVSFAPAYLQFNGHSAAVGPVATTNIGNGTDGVTLDGWVNWNGIGDTSHGQILFYNGNTSTAGFGMFSVPTAGGSLDLEILAGGETVIDTGIKLTAGQWYNVALSHVNDIFTLDVDGAVVYTSGPQGAFTMGHLDTPDFTLIGGNSGGTEGFNGGIADVSVWNTALSQSQVQAIEFGTLSGTEPGLAAYYALNDGSGTTATDAVNSAGNLSFVGNPAWQTSGSWPDSSVSIAENHAVTIEGISVNDVDAGSSQIEVTLAAGHGSLSLANSAGLDSVQTNSDGSVDLFGSQAAIDTALSHGVIYTPVTDFSGSDTLTVSANDQVSAALGGPLTGTAHITLNVEPGTPVFNSMTLTIAQGGTDVLTDANFSISDPDTSHFLYTVNNVTGGQFEVFNGTNWVSAPTGGFTTAQIEAGHVEFVQDGSATAPDFSIFATDGTNASAAIAPTINFTLTPPVAHDDVISGPTGTGWVLDTDNGHYYREVETHGSFEAAVAGAVADGGYLATITSAAEQSFVVNHVINGFDATWLGGETTTDRPDGTTVNTSVWSWVTGPEAGTQFSYTNWNPGEPSGGFNATTQWLQIGPTGGWNDAPDAGQPGDGNGAGYLEEWGGSSGQITFLENTGTTIATSVLLANDTDVNGFTLTVTAVGDTNGHSAQGGTVSLNGDIITYTPSTGHSGEDSFTYTISDGSQTSTATVSFDVAADVAPVLNSMTLTVAQGGAEVLTDANFNVTDPDSASFLYTVNNVTGGQFDVFNGTSWVSAPTGGFTTAQIEAGHVEFVQDGSAAVPNFSISVSDGINASAAVAPTVNFTPAHSGNLIVNGGFETNDFTGWTVGGDNAGGNHAEVGTGANQNLGDAPNHGLAEALLGGSGGDVTLSQTIATTAGEHYTVDFWLMNDASGNSNNSFGNDFSATWNGVALTTLTTDPGSTYTEYQFDVVGAANATQSTLQFSAQTGTGSWGLDDVSVLQGAPNTVQQMSDATTAVSGVNATDTLTVTPPQNALGTVSATAGNGTVEWQFQATNAQLDHLMGLTQSFTVSDTTNPSATQTVAVSVGGNGNDQFVFHQGVGADTMVNFSTLTTPQGTYAGDTIALESFNGITGVADVLTHLGADSHGNAVVDLGNHDSITFQGLSVAQISANASHIFQV